MCSNVDSFWRDFFVTRFGEFNDCGLTITGLYSLAIWRMHLAKKHMVKENSWMVGLLLRWCRKRDHWVLFVLKKNRIQCYVNGRLPLVTFDNVTDWAYHDTGAPKNKCKTIWFKVNKLNKSSQSVSSYEKLYWMSIVWKIY